MNLVPNRGAPRFYLPGFVTRRESQVALDFDPPHACRATQVPFRRMVIFFFPFWSRRPLSSLVVFYSSRGEHGLPNFGRKLATTILWSFSLPVGSRHRLRRRSFDWRRQPHYPNTVVVGTWMTCFIKCRHLQKPTLGAFAPLVVSFLPGPQRPQWLPGGVILARMRAVFWALIALDIQPIHVPASDSISKRGFLFHTVCIRCQIFAYQQPADRRPCGHLPVPCV